MEKKSPKANLQCPSSPSEPFPLPLQLILPLAQLQQQYLDTAQLNKAQATINGQENKKQD